MTLGSQGRKGHLGQYPGFMPGPVEKSWAPGVEVVSPNHRRALATLEMSAADSAGGSAAVQAELSESLLLSWGT